MDRVNNFDFPKKNPLNDDQKSSVQHLEASNATHLDCNSKTTDTTSCATMTAIDCQLVPCSNKCGKVLASQLLEEHVTNDCPLTLIDCCFKHAGCEVRLPRKDMDLHLGVAVVHHLTMHASDSEVKMKELKADNERLSRKCEYLESEVTKLEQKLKEVQSDFVNLKVFPKSSDKINRSFSNPSKRYQPMHNSEYVFALKPKVQLPNGKSANSNSITFTPVNLVMPDFERHQLSDDEWKSEPFYTHKDGYRMCLGVTANGQGSGKGSHVSVQVYLMNGEFDDELEWPFKGDITIQLLNQKGDDTSCHTQTICEAVGYRRITSDGDEAGVIRVWSINQFISLSELHPEFLRYDRLKFVILVELIKLACESHDHELITEV